jgi:hypothetical protein
LPGSFPAVFEKSEGIGTGAPRSPKRTWAENDGAQPHDRFY